MKGSAIAWVPIGMILACLLVAIATDLANRIIPNRLVLIILGCGLWLRLMSGPVPLLASLLSALGILMALSLLGAHDLLGWGDVKLIASVTFVVPADRVAQLLLAITLAGGLLSCLYLTARFVLRRTAPFPPQAARESGRVSALGRLTRREGARILASESMPYALAILGGVAYGLASE